MKKSILWFAIVLLIVIMTAGYSLIGCKAVTTATTAAETTAAETTATATTAAETTAAETTAAQQPVELTMINPLDVTARGAEVWDEMVAAFKAEYPYITLKVENSPPDSYQTKIMAQAAAGNLPDLMLLFAGSTSAGIYENNLAADLFPYLGEDKSKFLPAVVAPQYGGILHTLGTGIITSGLMYSNTKLLSGLGLSMPKTYEEFAAMAPTITTAGLYGIVMALKHDWVMQSTLFSAIVGRIGGQDYINKAVAGEASFDSPEFIDSLKIMKDLFDTGLLSKDTLQFDYPDPANLIATEKSVFMIGGDWQVGNLVGRLSEEELENIELSAFPEIKGQKGPANSTTVAVNPGFGMKTDLSKEKADAAWKWIYFYAGPKASEIRLTKQGQLPGYIMDISSYKISTLAKKLNVFQTKYTNTTGQIDEIISGEPITVLQNGLTELALGDTTPEKLAKDFEAAMKLIRK